MAVTVQAPQLITARSREEAIQAFGDGSDLTVLAGGTIVMPELTHGRLAAGRVLMLRGAGLAGVLRSDGRTTIGSMTPVSELEELAEPLRSAARGVADREIRAQATLGGNLCAPPGAESPRGDLQAALIALGAQVRSAGAGGERTEPLEDFLAAGPERRLVLEAGFPDPEAGAHAAVRRPHAHAYTILSVCAARTGGTVRIAASGAGPRAVRCIAAEQAFAQTGDPEAAAVRALDDATPQDDALASAWYRSRTLPVLVRRALSQLS